MHVCNIKQEIFVFFTSKDIKYVPVHYDDQLISTAARKKQTFIEAIQSWSLIGLQDKKKMNSHHHLIKRNQELHSLKKNHDATERAKVWPLWAS